MLPEREKIKNVLRCVAVAGLAMTTGCAPTAPNVVETSDYTINRDLGNTWLLTGKGNWSWERPENAKKGLFDLNEECQVSELRVVYGGIYRVVLDPGCNIRDLNKRAHNPPKRYLREYPNFGIIQISKNVVEVKGKWVINPWNGGNHAKQGLSEVIRECLSNTGGSISEAAYDSYFVATPESDCVLKLIQSNKAPLKF
ncbi:hypothetical protein HYW46_00045 [Candidatus Daviesbacteria bacterium]|nr:hypothetical protein [Candidatus Daviesbacteria bacterium]